MKTRGSEEITLREGLASKSMVKYSGFARFDKDLRGGIGGERVGPAQVEHRLCSAQELGAAHYKCGA